jgi:hypothetical protein
VVEHCAVQAATSSSPVAANPERAKARVAAARI